MRRFATQSERRFRGDSRYDLKNVTQGFACRLDSLNDDTAILERICRAYERSVRHLQSDQYCFGATEWWVRQRQKRLGPVIRALEKYDTGALRAMYANFFRDRCSTGLIGVPYGMFEAYFGGPVRDIHCRTYMGDALYRIDSWISETSGRFELADLAGPQVGNPFGVVIDGVLVQYRSEYQHYCAQRVLSCLDGGSGAIAEIGGGYGGMAYYLLRDGGRIRYLDFDVPESLALASYYLLKAFPSARFLLYGERDLRAETLDAFDIVLLPLFEMARIPQGSLNLAFSSHVMGDLSDDAMAQYLNLIGRMTTEYFLYLGDSRAVARLNKLASGRLTLLEGRSTSWNRHVAPEAEEVEYLYRLSCG